MFGKIKEKQIYQLEIQNRRNIKLKVRSIIQWMLHLQTLPPAALTLRAKSDALATTITSCSTENNKISRIFNCKTAKDTRNHYSGDRLHN